VTAKGLATRLPEGTFVANQRILLLAGLVALAVSLAGLISGLQDFLAAYLVAYMFALTLCVGSLFFVLIHHVTRSGWSVLVRRIAENISGVMPVMALLFVPIALGASQLYHHWWHLDEAVGDETLAGKRPYLNPVFWYVRAVIYLGFWVWLATWFRKRSLEQDQTGDPMISLQLSKRAAPGLVLLGLTYTFAVFDWIMSLNPHWFSTIYAVIFFGGTMMATYGTLALTAMWLSNRGWLKDVITAEHYHDLGKLLFAFMVFWSYTSFSQYMLQWYATLPEETEYWKMRLEGNWEKVGIALIIGHFAFPFAFLMSRHVKRDRKALAFAVVLLLAMHWLDLHFMVAPNFREHGFEPVAHWYDFTLWIGFAAILASFALGNLRKVPLVPERDPRLLESLHFTNI
jgi:hypothetical protein